MKMKPVMIGGGVQSLGNVAVSLNTGLALRGKKAPLNPSSGNRPANHNWKTQ